MTEMERLLEMVTRIDSRVQSIDSRVMLLEREKDDATPGPRVKLFVTEVVSPIQKSVDKIELSISKLADESKELYDAHKAFIDAEQKRKDKEAEEKTVGKTVIRWGAVAGAIGAIWFLFRIAGSLIDAYIQTRGGK